MNGDCDCCCDCCDVLAFLRIVYEHFLDDSPDWMPLLVLELHD